MNTRRDYYQVLGVPRDADAKALKKAFRQLARRYHPDTSTDPDAEQRFREIAEAYGVLSDPARRAAYDAHGFAGLAGASAEDLWGGIDFAGIFGPGVPGFGGLFERLFGRPEAGLPRGPPSGHRPAMPGLPRHRAGDRAGHRHRPHPARHPRRNRAAAGRPGNAQPRARRPAGRCVRDHPHAPRPPVRPGGR